MLLSDIHTLHAIENGERDAYRCGNAKVSFREFSVKVKQLAAVLIHSGIKPGDRVGIYLPRSIETAIAVHGVMRAGAVWVPLDMFAPETRTLDLIRDCSMQCVISSQSLTSKCMSFAQDVRLMIGPSEIDGVQIIDWTHVYSEDADNCPQVSVEPADPAYIIYTSGTTGKPKGIVHSHSSGLAYARLSTELYNVGKDDTVASHAPLHVDMCTFAYLSAPYAGATTVILPEAYLKMPASLSGLMEKEAISIWYSVPLALNQLMDHGVLDQRDLSSIRWVLYGGEPFQATALTKLMNAWSNATFCNVYGPAEVNQCTYYNIPEPPAPGTSVPLGHVWKETHHRIIDENGIEVAVGDIGELLIASTTRMREYWNRPDLTAAAFRSHLDSDGTERTYYCTGDLVSEDEQGLLHFMGRKDRQVKIKGYRLELSEIESTLNGLPDISSGAIVAPRMENGSRVLVGFVVPLSGTGVSEASIIEYLNNRLPSHAIPNTFTFVESLPATNAGKLDYATLERKAEQLV